MYASDFHIMYKMDYQTISNNAYRKEGKNLPHTLNYFNFNEKKLAWDWRMAGFDVAFECLMLCYTYKMQLKETETQT